MGYQEPNKVLSFIDEGISNIATILDIFSVVLGICNVFFSIFLVIESQSLFAFTWEEQQCTLQVLP